jgi:hypothetical protein
MATMLALLRLFAELRLLGTDLARALAREARRRRKTKSELRKILAAELGGDPQSLGREPRRQSLLVSRRSSEREALEFVERNADTRGWIVG